MTNGSTPRHELASRFHKRSWFVAFAQVGKGAPGRIRTCETRFRKILDDLSQAFCLRHCVARAVLSCTSGSLDDLISRHEPCHDVCRKVSV